jgi:hypothetical protein
MSWLNFISFGVGWWLGSNFKNLSKLYYTFQKQNCVNTILPLKIESYVPQKVINTIEMCKFIVEYNIIQLSQYLNQTCIKKGNRYFIRCVIEHKLYTIVLNPKRGPEPDYIWLDEKNIDRSEQVQSYIRANEAIVKDISPDTFGCEKLCKRIEGNILCTFRSKENIT